MKNLLLISLFILCFAFSTMAATYATATIQVLGIPEDGKTLTAGPSETFLTFEFAGRQPESENIWINTAKKMPIDHIEPPYSIAEIAIVIQGALRSNSDFVNCESTFDDVDTLTLKANEIGAVGNTYVLSSDSTMLVITGFSGGSD